MRSSLRLKPKTPLQKQQLHKINTILMHLINHSDSVDFRQPVDWQLLGLYDYPQVIKKPMDLGTINRKLKEKQKKYKTVQHVLNDMQLIWDNCKLYNPKQSEIFSLADKLQLAFRKMVKNYLPQLKVSTVTSKPHKPIISQPFTVTYSPDREEEKTSYEERKTFSQKMLYLNPDELQEMILKIKQISSYAFIQKSDEDAQIQVDRILAKDFLLCKEYLQNLFKLRDPSVSDQKQIELEQS